MVCRLWLLLGSGCTDRPEDGPVGPGRLSVTCAPQPGGALRWDCAVRSRSPAPVTVSWTADAETTTVGPIDTDTTDTTDTTVTLWGLPPDTDVRWQVTDGREQRSGTLHTAGLPIPLVLHVVGEPVARHVLFPVVCDGAAWLAIARTDGVVEWIEPAGETVSGFGFEPPDTVLATLDRHVWSRIRLDGRRIDQGPSRLPLHHDVASLGDGRSVRLTADVYPWDGGTPVVLDGLSIVDGEGTETATWSLADHTRGAVPPDRLGLGFWEPEFPGGGDWSHGNAVTVAPDGDLLVSLRWWNAVYRLAGPDAPDFGAVRWVLAAPGAPVASDLRLASETGDDPAFTGQHHPVLHPDGTLTLFDNGPREGLSRVLRFRIADGVATLIGVTPLGVRCGLLGSAYPLDDGGLLVTCADHLEAWEFAPGAVEPRWRMQVSCGSEPFALSRVVPVVLPGRSP